MDSNYNLTRVKNYLEKESVLEIINDELFSNKITCLIGQAGSGKTSTALEYAYRFKQNIKNSISRCIVKTRHRHDDALQVATNRSS